MKKMFLTFLLGGVLIGGVSYQAFASTQASPAPSTPPGYGYGQMMNGTSNDYNQMTNAMGNYLNSKDGKQMVQACTNYMEQYKGGNPSTTPKTSSYHLQ
ncbi:hypothetical protein LSG31_07160 [Fodinisporobacter ferrooxydans]|uniref:Uncharacterized protein n=1 Tax=Fodinisporobacter ferrooxydans TaxID=2901836 RepID=A0ABY4CND5_9BACL|nr:hypothetical protein LSG31_07160 [Alicyclobacillaceae bacterium MYW30-H2]